MSGQPVALAPVSAKAGCGRSPVFDRMRTRPGPSARNSRPSGANARLPGATSPVATVSIPSCVPSAAVITLPSGRAAAIRGSGTRSGGSWFGADGSPVSPRPAGAAAPPKPIPVAGAETPAPPAPAPPVSCAPCRGRP